MLFSIKLATHFVVTICFFGLVAGCSYSTSTSNANTPSTNASPTTSESSSNTKDESPIQLTFPDEHKNADYRILFLGNSHTSQNNLTGIVKMLMNANDPATDVYCMAESGQFLETLADVPGTRKRIVEGNWNVVVFQGQKISMSGKFTYPTEPAKDLCRLAIANGARAILFSEWGIRGKDGDAERFEGIYREIAEDTNAELSPVGAAWEASFASKPELTLHLPDGNHANIKGSFLAAAVLYSTITGNDPGSLPTIELNRVNADEQTYFFQIASKLLATRK